MITSLWATLSGLGYGIFQAFNCRAGKAFDTYFSTFVLIVVSALILAVAYRGSQPVPWRAADRVRQFCPGRA